MRRSVGVTVISILSMLGSLLTLGLGVLTMLLPLLMSFSHAGNTPAPPAPFKTLMMLASLMYIVPAIWGVITSIGLFRLRNWARISTIVFSIFLISMGGLSALTMLLIPMPTVPNAPEGLGLVIRVVAAAFWLALLAIAVWWLVFLTRPGVKAQFVSGSVAQSETAEPRPPGRPVSITVIAVCMLAGCVFVPLAFLFHTPVVFFTWLLNGWPAMVCYLAFAVVQIAIGIGLLRLKPAARLAAIALYLFGALNSAVFFLAPGAHARVKALMDFSQTMLPETGEGPRQYAAQLAASPAVTVVAVVAGVAMLGLALYFLITRKPAFCPTAR